MKGKHILNACRSFALVASLVSLAPDALTQVTYGPSEARYSYGVTSPAGATLVVIGEVPGYGATLAEAAADALQRAESRLREVNLDRSAVLRVRASLAPSEIGPEAFAQWNEAWDSFFPAGSHRPARTTAVASHVPDPRAGLVLDLVAVVPADRGYPAPVGGARSTPNPHIRLVGPEDNPTAIVSTQPGLFLTSGVLADRGSLADPESMAEQMRSSLGRLQANLGDHGLRWTDSFFLRVLLSPRLGADRVDFEAWSSVHAQLQAAAGGHGPAVNRWASPGFQTRGLFVEIEVWSVPLLPLPAFSRLDWSDSNPLLRMSGAENARISSGAAIGPNAQLAWLAGAIAPAAGSMTEEARGALTALSGRLREMGASMSDIAELRVFIVADPEGFDADQGAWNGVYGDFFANPEINPHKPVRTTWAVAALPGARRIMIEAVAVVPPARF